MRQDVYQAFFQIQVEMVRNHTNLKWALLFKVIRKFRSFSEEFFKRYGKKIMQAFRCLHKKFRGKPYTFYGIYFDLLYLKIFLHNLLRLFFKFLD